MQNILWGKLVLVLVAIVAVLQVVHLVLLSRLEARHHMHHHIHRISANLGDSSDLQITEVSDFKIKWTGRTSLSAPIEYNQNMVA